MHDAPGSEVARVSSYDELLSAIVARRKELGLTQLTVDDISGLQTGYTGKLECGTKRFGMMSLECVLGALGLELIVVRTVPHHLKQRRLPSTSCGRSSDYDAGGHRRVPAAA